MTMPSTTPATKPEPVRLLGAITSGLAAVSTGIGGIAYFADSRTVMGIAALVTLLCLGVNVGKDEYLRKQVIPSADVAAFVNDQRQLVRGPAAPVPASQVIPDPFADDLSNLDRKDGLGNPARDPNDEPKPGDTSL